MFSEPQTLTQLSGFTGPIMDGPNKLYHEAGYQLAQLTWDLWLQAIKCVANVTINIINIAKFPSSYCYYLYCYYFGYHFLVITILFAVCFANNNLKMLTCST